MTLTKILFRMEAFEDEVGLAAFLEMSRISEGLLSYCVNLENDLNEFGITYGVYDLIHEYGLYDYILNYCKTDFEIFSRMLSDMINISHIKQIANSTALFNETAFNEWLEGIKDLKEGLTPEILQAIVTLNNQTDTSQGSLIDTFSKIAAEESSRKMDQTIFELSNINKTEKNEK